MSSEEALALEKDPDFEKIVLLRRIDEESKDPSLYHPKLHSYEGLINKHSSFNSNSFYKLSPCQYKFFKDNSYVVLKGLINGNFIESNITDVEQWVTEISHWPSASKKWLLHYELPKDGSQSDKILCRAENFVDFHDKMGSLCKGILLDISSQLFQEQATLFKEKINFKLVGGAGFAAHQDTPAYIGLAKNHISALVAVDPCTVENGCLQVAPGQWNQDSNIPLLPSGVIDPESESFMMFKNLICEPGDVVFFNGYIPHRSTANLSTQNRRVLILTYNPLSEGEHHDAYYSAKHQGLEGFKTGNAISFQKDFQGTIVD